MTKVRDLYDNKFENLATVATSGSYSDLLNKPTLGTAASQNSTAFASAAQGSKADTAVQPAQLATVATTGNYSDLIGAPALATVATTGSYNDLVNKPTITSSFNGRTGVVVPQSGDYTAALVGLGDVTNDAQLKRAGGDFVTFAVKATPVAADILLIEDSAASGEKKQITVGALSANISITNVKVSSTTTFSTSSATAVTITGMTTTPAVGTYIVYYSASHQQAANNRPSRYGIYVNGVLVSDTERRTNSNDSADILSAFTQGIVTVNGSQVVDVRTYMTNGSSINVYERSLILMKVA